MKLINKLLIILLGCSSCDPNTHEFGFEVYNQSDREIDVCLNMWYLGIQDTLVPAYQDYDATSQYNYGFTTVEKKSDYTYRWNPVLYICFRHIRSKEYLPSVYAYHHVISKEHFPTSTLL